MPASCLDYADGRRLYRDFDIENATIRLRNAVTGFAPLASPLILWARMWLAGTELARGSFEKALAEVQSVRQYSGLDRYPDLIVRCDWLSGVVLVRTGRFAQGLEAYRDAVPHLQDPHEDLTLGGVDSLISEVLDYLGQDGEAWHYRYLALDRLRH
jgi:hypothetical protein